MICIVLTIYIHFVCFAMWVVIMCVFYEAKRVFLCIGKGHVINIFEII